MTNQYSGVLCELQAINYAFKKNSLQIFYLNGIDESYFTTYKEHFKFLNEYYSKYNQLPSKETFGLKFSDNFSWMDVHEPEDSIIDRLRESKLYRDLVKDFKKINDLMRDEKTGEAVELMASISQQYLKQEKLKCVDLISDVGLRYDSYIERVENPEKALLLPESRSWMIFLVGGT